MKEPMHSEAQESKESLSKVLKNELVDEDVVKEEPYQIEFEALEEDCKKERLTEASNFDTTMEEPTHSQVQELKKTLFSGILKEELVVEDGLQEGLCQDELQAMEKNTKEELILEEIVTGPESANGQLNELLPSNMKAHPNVELFKCSLCNYECNYKKNLHHHMLAHSKMKLFKCSECNYECSQMEHLCSHMLTHSNIKLFKCSKCKYECSQKRNLCTHMLTHSNIKLFKCLQCGYQFKRKGDLRTHMWIHSNIKLFKCSKCNYECNQKGNLRTHMLTHSNIKLFKCSKCNYECKHKGSLRSHMMTHSNIKLFKCSECNYECNRKENLRYHMSTHSNIKLFKCSECNYECNHKGSLRSHMMTHSNIKLFKCSECNYECNRKENLRYHMSTHSNIKLFKCSECNYECKHKRNLRSHMLAHSNIKLFKCSECEYESNQKRSLHRHMLTHSSIKLFKCAECNYDCNQKVQLLDHMLIHSNIKLFKCSECSYECNYKRSLRSHMLTHSNIKLFKCSECNYECNYKKSLRNHMLTHSNIGLFKCPECNYECNHKRHLQRHTLIHANTNSVNGCGLKAIVAPGQNDVGEQSPPDPFPATYITFLGDVPPSGSLPEQANTAPSYPPTKKKPLTKNHLGVTRTEWTEGEKKEIYWCATYARHPSFPKKGISKRTRDILLQRKIMPEKKVLETPDRKFSCIHSNILLLKTSIAKTQQSEIEKEVSQFISQTDQSHNTQQTWSWNSEKNLFLMECYFIDRALPTKAKTEAVSLAFRRWEIKPNDLMVYLFQEKYNAPLSRYQIIQHRNNISEFAKSKGPVALRKARDTLPTDAEIEKSEEIAYVKTQEMTFDYIFMKAVKDFSRRSRMQPLNQQCTSKPVTRDPSITLFSTPQPPIEVDSALLTQSPPQPSPPKSPLLVPSLQPSQTVPTTNQPSLPPPPSPPSSSSNSDTVSDMGTERSQSWNNDQRDMADRILLHMEGDSLRTFSDLPALKKRKIPTRKDQHTIATGN